MIVTALADCVVYRMHTPKWAHMPISGAGAAKHGGRLNRPGVDALYVALEVETAVEEYQQTSSLLPPGTVVSYQINLDKVADFRKGFETDRWPPIWQDFYCDWRHLWFDRRIEPPSWLIGDEVINEDVKGILFPSVLRPEGTNLVIYTATLSDSDQLSVYDPGNNLPRDQLSW